MKVAALPVPEGVDWLAGWQRWLRCQAALAEELLEVWLVVEWEL
jgi:hypothetical protein